MPRVKRTARRLPTGEKASPTPFFRAHTLGNSARTELASLLGLDDATEHKRQVRALARVEMVLGSYAAAVSALDNAPRAADYRARLVPIGKEAFALLNSVCALDAWMKDAITLELKDAHSADAHLPDGIAVVEFALGALADATVKAVKRYGDEQSLGRKGRPALLATIAALRRIFREARGDDADERVRHGAQSNFTEYENEELDFLRVALKDANIEHPTNLRDLIRGRRKGT